ncbi:F-box domain-containing protein [Xylaria palmicola]|nr:F-box domain-containing protein [Xylaria palmicola]
MGAIFEPHQSDAVARVAAYRRRDLKLAVVCARASEHDRVRASVSAPFSSAAVCDLGILERLPLELLSSVCLYLDVQSCLVFRQSSRRARQVVSSLYQYRALTKHGLESLRAVLRTGSARYLTIPDLYRLLCTHDCAICRSAFGGFLFLPTASRCCFTCIEESSHLGIVSLSALGRASGIPRAKLRRLVPVLRTLPGTYTTLQKAYLRRIEVVSRQQAVDGLHASGLSLEQATAALAAIADNYVWRLMMSTTLPLLNPATGQVQHGVSCKGCQIALEDAPGSRFPNLYERRDRLYSRRGYLDHFPLCPEAVELWRASKEGTVAVWEPEFTRNNGRMGSPDK